MQVSKQEIEGHIQTVTFEFSADEIDPKLNREFQKLQRQVKIPGFRKGKVPLKMIRQRYEASIINDLQMDAINDSWAHVIQELDPNPLSQPDLDVIQPLRLNKGFIFALSFEVIPDFDLPAPENLEGERVVWTVSDARIDQEVEKAQEHFGEWTPLKRRKKSRDKDQVTIDLKTYQDGEVVDELTNPEFQLKIGDPENIAPLEKAIKGLKVGESFDLECDLSKIDADDSDDSEENIVHFVGEVLNIEEQTPAPIETLFESFSVENEEELREELKKSLITYQTQVSDRELHDSVVEQLVNSEIEIPAPIVERIAHKQLHQNHHHKEGESCDHESSPEQLEEASAQVIRDLKLEAIIHRHKKEHQIEVTESEFNSKLISMLQNAGEIAMQLFQFYQMPEYQARLKQTLLDEKVINYYIELANLPEVERVIEVKEAE